MFVLGVAGLFLVLGIFAGMYSPVLQPATNDLNKDGEVTLQDFSIALSLVDNIKNELRTK